MNIEFEDPALEELYLTGKTHDKKYRGLSDGIIKKYHKSIDYLKAASRIESLYKYNSLNYETLTGNFIGCESVRVDNKYRIIFHSYSRKSEIIITEISILELTNHYDKV